jgi:hypothetical protein
MQACSTILIALAFYGNRIQAQPVTTSSVLAAAKHAALMEYKGTKWGGNGDKEVDHQRAYSIDQHKHLV